jgi:hypothetical protein
MNGVDSHLFKPGEQVNSDIDGFFQFGGSDIAAGSHFVRRVEDTMIDIEEPGEKRKGKDSMGFYEKSPAAHVPRIATALDSGGAR